LVQIFLRLYRGDKRATKRGIGNFTLSFNMTNMNRFCRNPSHFPSVSEFRLQRSLCPNCFTQDDFRLQLEECTITGFWCRKCDFFGQCFTCANESAEDRFGPGVLRISIHKHFYQCLAEKLTVFMRKGDFVRGLLDCLDEDRDLFKFYYKVVAHTTRERMCEFLTKLPDEIEICRRLGKSTTPSDVLIGLVRKAGFPFTPYQKLGERSPVENSSIRGPEMTVSQRRIALLPQTNMGKNSNINLVPRASTSFDRW